MRYRKAKNKTTKWILTKKENLDVAGIAQTNVTDRKTFRHNVFYWKIGQRGKRKKDRNGLVWRWKEAILREWRFIGVGANKSKPMKTVSRYISRGLIEQIRENNNKGGPLPRIGECSLVINRTNHLSFSIPLKKFLNKIEITGYFQTEY